VFIQICERNNAPISTPLGRVAWRSFDPSPFFSGSVRRSRGEATGRMLIRTPDRWFYAECPHYDAEARVQTGSAYVLVRSSVLTRALDFPPKLL
jgi:hypothetical protein